MTLTRKEIRERYYALHRDEVNARTRERRKLTNNADTRKYEKTPKGFLVRKYRNMESRVTGIQKLKAHLYKGKSLLDRETFYQWATQSEEFWKLFRIWEQSDYSRKLCPTVDRINPQEGYELSNMEWVTHSENSRRSSLHKKI